MSNSISTMQFIDYLKWDGFSDFLSSPSVVKKSNFADDTYSVSDGTYRKYSVKHYGNLWKYQIFNLGGDAVDK